MIYEKVYILNLMEIGGNKLSGTDFLYRQISEVSFKRSFSKQGRL